MAPMTLQDDLAALAEERDFSGVTVVSRGDERLVELARGSADRANRRPNTLATQFGIARATKGDVTPAGEKFCEILRNISNGANAAKSKPPRS